MKQPYWKPQHEVFIRHMLCHQDAIKAYRAAYPKASKASARIGGIRLNNYPHIRQQIQPILAQRSEEADKLAMQQALARKKHQAARRHHIRTVIAAIARKEIKKDRRFIVNGQTITLQEDISHGTMLALLSLDLKLAEGYDNWSAIKREFEMLTRNTSPTKSVISNGAEQREAEGEISRAYASSRTAELQEISPDGRNDGAFFRQQTVTNSPENSLPTRTPANTANPENPSKTGNKITTGNKFLNLKRYFDTSPPLYQTYKETLVMSTYPMLKINNNRHLGSL